MSDLKISAVVLNDLHRTLTNISNDLDGACRRLRSTDATGVGSLNPSPGPSLLISVNVAA